MSGKLKLGLLVSLAASLGFAGGWYLGEAPTELAFFAVGQGDCTVFRHAGTTILIDVGPKTEFDDAGKRLVIPKLRKMGVNKIALILLTHPDLDHVGGLTSVMKSYPNTQIATSAEFRDHPEMAAFLRAAGVPLEKVLWLPRESSAQIGEWRLRFYCPDTTFDKDNEGSVFLHLSNGKATAVLTGDAGIATEEIAADRYDWSAQVLKAGHHGSNFSLGRRWLNEVKPKFSVFSAGVDNVYGHPSPDTMGRASRFGAKVLRTDRDGDVRFVAGEHGFLLSQ